MELLLPVFLKLFPNMLPSTFQDKMKEEVLIQIDQAVLLTELLNADMIREHIYFPIYRRH